MTITRAESQVTWPTAANSKSVAAGVTETSEITTLDATCVSGAITCKADNAGTPAVGDLIDFYLAGSCGDPDGTGTDEYPTDIENMVFLCQIDTNDTDADSKTVRLPVVPQNLKVVAVSGASSNSITVSATIEELRAA